ncbi:MAG: c-type cytochrome [Balneolales bacterium]
MSTQFSLKHLKNSYILIISLLLIGACNTNEENWPPKVQSVPDDSPVLTPEDALETFYLPPGYEIELVASEPLVEDPVTIDFDPDGRIWVVEMRGYMPNVDAEGEKEPVGRIVVLEDTSGNGSMDKRTVYMDELVLPRAIKVLDEGVLIGNPPYLWMTQDTTGNLQADVVEVVTEDFGDPDRNPEYNPNGLMWGMDNRIHNTQYDGRFSNKNGKWEKETTPLLGQWGISMDNYGRIYRNSNSWPLNIDYISSHYYTRNDNLDRKRGIFQSVNESSKVWPVRPTTGVNRGYRKGQLRDDNTLAEYTAASGLAVYRGDRYPKEVWNNVFVPEPSGNLVQRYVITEDNDGYLSGRNPYEDQKADFLTSTDERFRPVNIHSAPDGTLYIVDMYRGILQHKFYLTDYLKNEISKRNLEAPMNSGRIYRVVHESSEPDKNPQLSAKSLEELVPYLEHSNGWWRDTAQRLLVERQASSVVPELQQLVHAGEKDYTRLHALWTLDGINEIDTEVLEHALSDESPHVRAAAIRIAEPGLSPTNSPLREAVMGLIGDGDPVVSRQLAASAGEFPLKDREDALLAITEHHGDDPIVVSLVVNALAGHELAFLSRYLEHSEESSGTSDINDAIETLVITILRAGNSDGIRDILAWIGDEDKPEWQRLSLLSGVDDVAPSSTPTNVRLLELDHKPTVFLTALNSEVEEVNEQAEKVADKLGWPGKPREEAASIRPLTSEEEERFERGSKLYSSTCASCHQNDGQGMQGVAAPLVNSEWVLGRTDRLTRILLHGMDGDMLMPSAGYLSDEEIAAIITYIRREWGHEEDPVDASHVFEIRGVTTGRESPWTKEELNSLR